MTQKFTGSNNLFSYSNEPQILQRTQILTFFIVLSLVGISIGSKMMS